MSLSSALVTLPLKSKVPVVRLAAAPAARAARAVVVMPHTDVHTPARETHTHRASR